MSAVNRFHMRPGEEIVPLKVLTEFIRLQYIYSVSGTANEITKHKGSYHFLTHSSVTGQLCKGSKFTSLRHYLNDFATPITKPQFQTIKKTSTFVTENKQISEIQTTQLPMPAWDEGEKSKILAKARELKKIKINNKELDIVSVSDLHKRTERHVRRFEQTFLVPKGIAEEILGTKKKETAESKELPSASLPAQALVVVQKTT